MLMTQTIGTLIDPQKKKIILKRIRDGKVPLFMEPNAEHLARDANNAMLIEHLESKDCSDDVALARKYLRKGVDINAMHHDKTPLMVCAERGHLKIAKMLIRRGADVNAINSEGWTAVFIASDSDENRIEIVRLLIKHNADLNIRANNDWTTLQCAIYHNHTDIAELLDISGARMRYHA